MGPFGGGIGGNLFSIGKLLLVLLLLLLWSHVELSVARNFINFGVASHKNLTTPPYSLRPAHSLLTLLKSCTLKNIISAHFHVSHISVAYFCALWHFHVVSFSCCHCCCCCCCCLLVLVCSTHTHQHTRTCIHICAHTIYYLFVHYFILYKFFGC